MSRYNREYHYKDVVFYLSDYRLWPEQCYFLMLKIVDQTVRDYCSLFDSDSASERLVWESADAFIHDDDYRIYWGDWLLSTEDFLDIIDINISWFRKQCIRKFKIRYGEENEYIKNRERPRREETKCNPTSYKSYTKKLR